MPAVLAPDFAESVLWQEQARYPPLLARALPREADIVVVGAGYCGLAAAMTTAHAGKDVVVLEERALGWGASSRNGGMVIPELKSGPAALTREYGEQLGPRLYTAVNEAFDWTEKLIANGIDCDYARTGQLYLAHHERMVPYLRKTAAEHEALGEPVHVVERDELADEIGSTIYPGGIVIERTGGLHPARFHAGLARLARRAGAVVHDHTPVTTVTRRAGGGFDVGTRRGTITCEHVIAATNAYADDAIPELRRRVLPVGSYIITTEPLPEELAMELSPRGRMFVDTKSFLFYWRLTPDRRLLFGGRKSLVPPTLTQARDFLYESMVRVHPQLVGTPITHAWGGKVAITLDRMPHVGEIDGVRYATGCNGSGVALNTWLGSRLGDMVLGDEPPPFAELTHRPIPLWKLRKLYLPVVGQWFKWHDRGFGE